jgi:hypothetical protein
LQVFAPGWRQPLSNKAVKANRSKKRYFPLMFYPVISTCIPVNSSFLIYKGYAFAGFATQKTMLK